MTFQQAKEKLELARKRQREIRKEIEQIKKLLKEGGIDTAPPKIDLVPRNKMIFKKWKQGNSFSAIAKACNLSATMVSNICRRIEYRLRNDRLPDQYKDLMRYKEEE